MPQITKAAIREMARRADECDEPIHLDSADTVGGAVRFHVDGDRVEAGGFADQVERGITTVDDLVDYVWRERKRLIWPRA